MQTFPHGDTENLGWEWYPFSYLPPIYLLMYMYMRHTQTLKIIWVLAEYITLDPRLPFPYSVWGIFPGPVTTQKVYQGIEWFSQLAATMNDSFEHVD